jgi:hypothetical protein
MRYLLAILLLLALPATVAFAGSPHVVSVDVVVSGDTVTATAKEAGLGDEAQIVATLSGDAACVNPGGNHPQAANKETFSTSAVVPVQNGHADYSMTLTATFSPDCAPPMHVVWSNVVLVDETNGLTYP